MSDMKYVVRGNLNNYYMVIMQNPSINCFKKKMISSPSPVLLKLSWSAKKYGHKRLKKPPKYYKCKNASNSFIKYFFLITVAQVRDNPTCLQNTLYYCHVGIFQLSCLTLYCCSFQPSSLLLFPSGYLLLYYHASASIPHPDTIP